MTKHLQGARLLSLLIILAALLFYQAVVSGREQLVQERTRAIAQVEAYNAAVLAQQSGEPAAPAYQDGQYQGSGTGFGGQIQVQVTIQAGKLSAITVLEASGEDEAYFVQAQTLLQKILDAQSTQVDTVSGATFSSNGLLQAVQNALGKAAA